MKLVPVCSVLFSSLLTAQKATEPILSVDESQRRSTRLYHWVQNHSEGHCVISYGPVSWNPRFEKVIAGARFPRWRLGRNHWTTLDTDVDMKLGGWTIPAGHYFLALDRSPTIIQETGMYNYQLVLLDPQLVRARRLDARQAAETAGGIYIWMRARKRKDAAKTLEIKLTPSDKGGSAATLEIAFGPRSLVAAVELVPSQPESENADVGKVLSADAKWIFQHAKAMRIYALHPKRGPAEAQGDQFHGLRVTGQKSVSGPEGKGELIRLIYRGLQLGREAERWQAFTSNAWTTEQRHGIRAEIGHLSVDIVIDSRGHAATIYREDGTKTESDSFSPTVVGALNRFFRKHGLRPSK